MIPEKRVKQALLNVEIREVLSDLSQLNGAILHFLSGGKHNYDTAKSNSKKEEYENSSDEILSNLEKQREEKERRLEILSDELNSLNNEE